MAQIGMSILGCNAKCQNTCMANKAGESWVTAHVILYSQRVVPLGDSDVCYVPTKGR